MDYAQLKKEIKAIADIAAGVPDAFREKCFEVLLNNLVSGTPKSPPPLAPPGGDSKAGTPSATNLPITTQLRVFMQKNGVSEDEIKAIVMVADGDAHFIREPAHGKIAGGQTEWALLLALKNCILKNDLSADPEEVRSVCQEKGFYDSPNFAANFRQAKCARLFKGKMVKQGAPQGLTSEGQTELTNVIRKLAAVQ